ncbi:response regulator [Qipengyuania sp. YG27]|uniref:Response regulator n=1 Tax=Qipengyuania mesophila TaxID=2867246 RepID=A0ABS7JX66_9SPHN|nr:response regulator [Qipengyuania mesophila]
MRQDNLSYRAIKEGMMAKPGSSTEARKSIYLIDDDPMFRRWLHGELTDFELTVWPFGSAADFLEYAPTAAPAPIIIDLRMPEMDGLQLLQELRKRGIGWPVLISTAHADIRAAVSAMQLGAVDFLEKPFAIKALLDLVEVAFDSMGDQTSALEKELIAFRNLSRLTNREREVAIHLSHGLSNKEVARQFEISPRTVEAHRSSIFSKLEIKSIAELVRMLFAANVVKP